MKKIYIDPGCIGCGSCESVCPEVFQVKDVSCVKEDADLEKNEECIKEASAICPMGVIRYEE